MRRILLGSAVLVAALAVSPRAEAQIGNGFSDPFFFYYGFYQPRQQVLAAQSLGSPTSNISALATARQDAALVDRSRLYDPSSPFSDLELDPLRPFGPAGGRNAIPRITPSGITSSNLRGNGPPGWYNRTNSYYPGLRSGRGGGLVGGGAAPLRLRGGGGNPYGAGLGGPISTGNYGTGIPGARR